MDFGEVLSSSWKIVWKHKILWIFGILAGCSRGSGSGSANSGSNYTADTVPPELEQFGQFLADNPWIIAAIIIAILFLVLLAVFLGTVGKIGLIKGTLQADAGVEHMALGELFNTSMPYFWRVFGLTLLVGLGIFIVLMVFLVPIILLGIAAGPALLLCLIPLMCLFIPLAWVIGVVLEQGTVALVAEELGIFDALRRGWEVVKANAGSMVVMALILYIGGGVVSFLIALPIFLIVAPVVFALFFGATGGSAVPVYAIAGLCFVVYLPVLLVLNGILTAYIQSAWTLTFKRLTGRKPDSMEIIEADYA